MTCHRRGPHGPHGHCYGRLSERPLDTARRRIRIHMTTSNSACTCHQQRKRDR